MLFPKKISLIMAISILIAACGGDGSKKLPAPIAPPVNITPIIELFTTSSDKVTTGTSVRFDWKITDTSGDAVSCVFDPLGNGEVIIISDCLSTQSTAYTYADHGIFKPKLTATDNKNASSTTVTRKDVWGDPTIYLHRPLANEIVGPQFTVNAQVSSIYEVSSVTAQIGGKSIPSVMM